MAILNESLCIKVKAQAALLDSNHNSAVTSGGHTACIRYSVLNAEPRQCRRQNCWFSTAGQLQLRYPLMMSEKCIVFSHLLFIVRPLW